MAGVPVRRKKRKLSILSLDWLCGGFAKEIDWKKPGLL
jgi:hypothetical protein